MNENAGTRVSPHGFLPSPQALFVVAGVLVLFGSSAVLSPFLTALAAIEAKRDHDRALFWFAVAATIICVVLAVLISLPTHPVSGGGSG